MRAPALIGTNPTRPNCKIGLEQTYGLKIAQVLPLGFGSPQAKQAVLTGKADVVETGTTDATLDAQGLVLLQDDKNLQEAENILPVVNTQKAGYLNRVSVGSYSLSPVGYNLVEHTLGSDA